ncbi:hypothetical protein Tco_0798257 [Tanacetum coccineum]
MTKWNINWTRSCLDVVAFACVILSLMLEEKNEVVKDGVTPSSTVASRNSSGIQEVNSSKAGHDDLHDENDGDTPRNFTNKPNKATSYAYLSTGESTRKSVKLYGVLVMAFSEDGLSVIATKLGIPLMLDSYTSNDECPKNLGLDVAKKSKIHSQAPRGVLVGPKVDFKPIKQLYSPISKRNNLNTSGSMKKDVESSKEVSNPNPFDVLNLVENDVDFGTNEGTSNVASKEANFDGSLFWNVGSSSIKGWLLLEEWRETYENADYDYDPYDDDMYEGQEIPNNIQSICDNLDIKLRGHKKK